MIPYSHLALLIYLGVFIHLVTSHWLPKIVGAQWLSGWVLDSRPRDRGFESHRGHFIVSYLILA